jgi:putative hemolysin
VILALWRALARDMQRRGLQQMIGCVSVPMRDGGHVAASLWRRLSAAHLAPAPLRVRPLVPLPVDQLDGTLDTELPPLLKGYLRLGAKLIGPPGWDPDLHTAEFPVLVTLASLPDRYRRHFLDAR